MRRTILVLTALVLALAGSAAAMADAWAVWGTSPAAYAAFTWCRAVGRRPAEEEQ